MASLDVPSGPAYEWRKRSNATGTRDQPASGCDMAKDLSQQASEADTDAPGAAAGHAPGASVDAGPADVEHADVEHADLYARIIAAQTEIATLAHDPNRVIEAVIHRAQELTRSAGAVVEILDGDHIVYWAASGSASGQVGLRMPLRGSLSGLCITENRVLRCDDAEHDARDNREACPHCTGASCITACTTCRRSGSRSSRSCPAPCPRHACTTCPTGQTGAARATTRAARPLR